MVVKEAFVLRSEKLRLENTGQIVWIGSPGWGAKDLEHKFGTEKHTATIAVGWGWELPTGKQL